MQYLRAWKSSYIVISVEYDKIARHGNYKDLKNIYFDSLYFILTQAIFLNYPKISTHANFMDPRRPRQNFDPRHFFDPRQDFTDPRHPREVWPMPPRGPRIRANRAIWQALRDKGAQYRNRK